MDKREKMIDLAIFTAENDALSEGEMRGKIYVGGLYDYLKEGWANSEMGDTDEFDEYKDDVIEAYISAYADQYHAVYKQDRWGNYDLWLEDLDIAYDELERNYDKYCETENATYMEDAKPVITYDDWDYMFSFDEDGDVYVIPNEENSIPLYVNLAEDSKKCVIDAMYEFLK